MINDELREFVVRLARDITAVVDAVVAGVVLVLVATALPPAQRIGSTNWALAYSIGCVIWLAAGRRWCGWLAVALGAVYDGAVLFPANTIGSARLATALVNASSPVLYWAMAIMAAAVWRQVGSVLDANQQRASRQRRELAMVAERQRLGREVHQSVLATLDLIAGGGLAGTDVRSLAHLQATAVRRAFADPGPAQVDAVLSARVATLAAERAAAGWTIEVVDDELDHEPTAAATSGLCESLASLVAGRPNGNGTVRVRIAGTDDGVELTVRLHLRGSVEDAMIAVQACLTPVSGTVRQQESLPGETRLLLWVPA